MARKKFFDDVDDQQENRGGGALKPFQNQNKQNHLSSSPPRGSVLGLVHRSGRTNQKLNHHPNNNGPPVTAEESLYSVVKQLSNDGLTIREMPGDGNCLFRALSDQLEGNTRNHVLHRRAVVQFMRENRSDFEPFVEDDQPFDKYVQGLSQPGTFAGNDAIVAFARLHNVTVVIHQLNSPAWLIHPSNTESHNLSSGREVHIAYHNGDHYNSVRKIGDDSDSPSDIRFVSQGPPTNGKSTMTNHLTKLSTTNTTTYHSSSKSSTVTSEQQPRSSSPSSYPSDLLFGGNRDEDFWIKDKQDIERLVEDVLQQTGYPDPVFVRDTLMEFNFDMVSTIDFILTMIMAQAETESESTPQPTPVSEDPLVTKQVEALAQQSGKVLLDLDTGIGISQEVSSGKALEEATHDHPEAKNGEPPGEIEVKQCNLSGCGSDCSGSPPPSPSRWESRENSANEDDAENSLDGEQNQFSVQGVVGARNDTKPRLSTRQRNDLKKKERKFESNRRKKTNSSPRSENSPPPSAQYSTPGFRSLNI